MANLGPDVNGRRSIAVVGGGWAGCAAAATLAAAGVSATLFEASAELGGRGRRLRLPLGDRTHTLDNGQHLMVGAYTAIARLLAAMDVELDRVVERRPFELRYPDGFELAASRLPAPWHLLSALLRARGPAWRDRIALARFLHGLRTRGWRVGPDRDALGWLASHGQGAALIERVWRPLCVAALNTAPENASAQIFANVLRDTLGAASDASMLWLPRVDLSALLPEAAERFVARSGGHVLRSARVERVGRSDGRFGVGTADGPATVFDAVVYAAPPAQLARIAAPLSAALTPTFAAVESFRYEPICTVYLKYGEAVALPHGFGALIEDRAQRAYGQWVFDRGATDPDNRGVLAVVVSAGGAHRDEPLPALCEAIAAQLARQLGLPSPVAARAIVEKHATLAALPGLRRPGHATPVPGFALAGDWTDSDYPSTLEAAVRSGVAAARHLIG